MRLVMAIVSTLLEEAALAVIVLVGLPRLGIEIPLGVLIVLMVVWGAFAVFTYRMGSRALKKKPLLGLPAMIGSKGKVSTTIAPEGFVRIKAELWEAKSQGGDIDIGEEVVVVGQEALKLIVRKSSIEDSKRPEDIC
ncbi:NfeD family protein [Chloroflexota bacterium]